MSEAKQEILARVRQALGRSAIQSPPELLHINRSYRQAGELSLEERVDLFVDRLKDYGAQVYQCHQSEIRQVIDQILRSRQKSGLLISRDIPSEWLPEGKTSTTDQNLSYEAIDHSEGVLTRCALAIASTGTILLRHSPAEGRRALSLIPDYHLCVIAESQIVETVPEAIRAASTFGSYPLTTVSGPSATSDIEMTRIKGVHGPRTLDVILVR